MKSFILVNSGLEETAQYEVKELMGVSAKVYDSVLEVDVKDYSPLFKLQSVRRVIVSLGKTLDKVEQGDLLKNYFSNQKTFKVEVENVKGNEKRLEIAKKVAGLIYEELKKENIDPKLELKKPEMLVVVYFNGKDYFLGIDENVEELNSRKYRVFAHSASFKGDLAYYFVQKSGFVSGEKLLVGFCKDGTMAIEAALFSKEKVYGFDSTRQNVTAARKNAQLAGVEVDIQKYALDELDVRFSEKEFARLIFQITTKDESQLNEIYYQANYILKKKGTLLLIARPNWEVTVSDKFKLLSEGEVKKGESVHKMWLLEKK
jgi:23S rRNA G2445 N2-methylase RlmL